MSTRVVPLNEGGDVGPMVAPPSPVQTGDNSPSVRATTAAGIRSKPSEVGPPPSDTVSNDSEQALENRLDKLSNAEAMALAVAQHENPTRRRRFSMSETPTRLQKRHGLVAPCGSSTTEHSWSPAKLRYSYVRKSSLDDIGVPVRTQRRLSSRERLSKKVERWGDGIPKGGHESLDYDEAEKDQLRAVAELPDSVGIAIARRKMWLTGALLLAIGLSAGTIAYLMTRLIGSMSDLKWGWVQESVDEGNLVMGWLKLMGFCIPLTLFAALMTYWCPDAAGSGIPYVKSYLNGNGLKLASFSTLFTKVVGISCMVICGVPVGREGPMVHSGAVVAAVLTRVWAHLVHWHLRVPPSEAGPTKHPQSVDSTMSAMRRQERLRRAAWTAGGYDNDRDRRNFVSMGAAAGVAAAFNAPIGGILFSLEEVSSFWDQQLTWTTFLAAAIAAYTVNYWSSGISGTFEYGGLVLFAAEDETTYQLWELVPFIMIGVVCGVIGAVFNVTNKWITLRRKSLLGSRPRARVLEAVGVVCLVVSIYYWVPAAYGCTAPPEDASGSGRRLAGAASLHPVRHACSGGSGSGSGSEGAGSPGEMNEMATLLLQPMEASVVQLFTRGTSGYLSLTTLAAFVPLFFVSAVFTYGIAVPSGLFIPCMMMGAGLGRFCGELIRAIGSSAVDPGVYALVGAAGMLGGVTRMTISLAVILVEVSHDIRLLLPIMLSILLAKAVGDHFTRSLYDIHILLSGATLLVPAPTPHSTSYLLTARSLLQVDRGEKGSRNSRGGQMKPLKTVTEAETLRTLSDLLNSTKHHAFPVVSEQSGLFAGLIGRSKLEALVAQAEADGARRRQKIDLRIHYDHAPYTVHELLPLYRVSRLFMTMGLRHLCVLDGMSRVVGIITRKDLARIPTSYGDDEMHLVKHGASTQKRMLDARHQASHARAASQRRRMSDPGPLPRTSSEPNVCNETPKRMRPGSSFEKDKLSHTDSKATDSFRKLMANRQDRSAQQIRLMKRRASV